MNNLLDILDVNNIYFVSQGATFKQEKAGKYIWAPLETKSGLKVHHWDRMLDIKIGDIIIHYENKKIYALSKAKTTAYLSKNPFPNDEIWEKNGRKVDLTLVEFESPIITGSNLEISEQLYHAQNNQKHFPFNKNKTINQGYLFKSNIEMLEIILEELSSEEKNKIKLDLTTEHLREDLADLELLEDINKEALPESPSNVTNKKEVQEPKTINQQKYYPRDKRISKNALALADYKCEYDNTHPLFERKNQPIDYTEPHHLIPLSKQEDFSYSLDVEANIVSLCSHCHNKIHYGKDNQNIIEYLFNNRKKQLFDAGIPITLDDLLSYY